MATKLEADTSPIVVDGHNSSSGTTTIQYEKDSSEELWVIRTTGANWNQPNLHVLTGLGDEALFGGAYPITLQPGDHYIVSVYQHDRGPLTPEPSLVTTLDVSCLWKDPGPTKLITDENTSRGGTWHFHTVFTGNVPTRIVMIGVSREPPSFDSNGIPRLTSHDGEPTTPLKTTTIHEVEIKPLFPGNHYFFVVLVTDGSGNWDFSQTEFTTLRRKITVEFPTIHIYNDGDYATVGEGEFWFRVFRGQVNQPIVIQEFHLPQQDIDDWSETDRPYAVGFAHLGSLKVVKPGEQDVGVASWGVEEDGPLEADEGATNSGVFLPLPSGKSVEKVTNSSFSMDCPTSTVDSTFHYGVDVRWSVEYAT